jgi:hypothetical protein
MFCRKSVYVIFIIMLTAGCVKKKFEAGSPEEVLNKIKEKGNSMSVMDFYTEDTIIIMKKYMKMTGMKTEASVDVLSFIPENSEYNVIDKKIEGSNCTMNLVFSKHSSENAMGYTVAVKMVKEGNAWKIDRKDDFRTLVESFEKKGAEAYLDRIR